MINKILILLIKTYQNTLSYFFPVSCRFTPSCSEYMVNSLYKYGSAFGFWLGVKRICRCHPFSKHSGYDPA